MYVKLIILGRKSIFKNGLSYKTEKNINIGDFVEIEFQNKLFNAIVFDINAKLEENIKKEKIKEIIEIKKGININPKSIKIAKFISEYYKSNMEDAINLFTVKSILKGKIKEETEDYYKLIKENETVKGSKQKKIINFLKDKNFVDKLEIKKAISTLNNSDLKKLLDKKIIELKILNKYEDKDINIIKKSNKILTKEQESALNKIEENQKPLLIHGVTGSGKTEIYLNKILKEIKKGKQCILLVPEISLTEQTINYFKSFLGDRISVFHSKLSEGEKLKEWWKVKKNYSRLIIGSRSALFAPINNLSLIIIDEEHEWTYKQESSPYYHTRKVAEKMSEVYNAKLIIASATPSAESFYKSKIGYYDYIELKERVNKEILPTINIVDLREEFQKRNFSIFSLKLQLKIKERLAKKEQIILFVNQRGIANAVVCRDCGYTEKCPNCDISLKLHKNFKGESLLCHYCNYSKTPELLCPNCHSAYIKNIGVGTQRVEDEVKKLYPEAKILRADKDSTKEKNAFKKIYNKFLNENYDILIGTQMIAKGLDFSEVSLIGIILADIGLHIPDFRSSERLFQILTQVSGRCGRKDKKGEIVLQTYNPKHPTIEKIANYEYKNFINEELKNRKELNYPPFSKIIKFTVVGEDFHKMQKEIKNEILLLEDIFKINNLSVKITHASAGIPKIANKFYYNVLLKSENPSIIFKHWKKPNNWRTDIDPVHST